MRLGLATIDENAERRSLSRDGTRPCTCFRCATSDRNDAGGLRPILRSLLAPRERADEIATFETDFAAYVGCRHAIAVSSGRLAIHLISKPEVEAGGSHRACVQPLRAIERFCQLGFCRASPMSVART